MIQRNSSFSSGFRKGLGRCWLCAYTFFALRCAWAADSSGAVGEVAATPNVSTHVTFLEALQSMPEGAMIYPLRDFELTQSEKSSAVNLSVIITKRNGRWILFDTRGDAPVKLGILGIGQDGDHGKILSPGDRVEIPRTHATFTVPPLPTEVKTAITPFVRYDIDRSVSTALFSRGPSAHFPKSQDFYKSFARQLGCDFDKAPKDCHIDITRLEKLYEEVFDPLIQSGKIKADEVLRPGLILWDPTTAQYATIEAWREIPKGLILAPSQFIDDRVERAMNAQGFFSLANGQLATHDLMGHIGSYLQNPQYGASIIRTSRALLKEHRSGVPDPTTGLVRISKDIEKIPYTMNMRRFSVFSEFQAGLNNPQDRELFERLTWLNLESGHWRGSVLDRYEEQEKIRVASILEHADSLLQFYRDHMRLVGGLARDEILQSRLSFTALDRILRLKKGALDKFRDALKQLTLPDIATILEDPRVRNDPFLVKEVTAQLELSLEFWTARSPSEFLAALSADSTRLEEELSLLARKTEFAVHLLETGDSGEWYWFRDLSTPEGIIEHSEFWNKKLIEAPTIDSLLNTIQNFQPIGVPIATRDLAGSLLLEALQSEKAMLKILMSLDLLFKLGPLSKNSQVAVSDFIIAKTNQQVHPELVFEDFMKQYMDIIPYLKESKFEESFVIPEISKMDANHLRKCLVNGLDRVSPRIKEVIEQTLVKSWPSAGIAATQERELLTFFEQALPGISQKIHQAHGANSFSGTASCLAKYKDLASGLRFNEGAAGPSTQTENHTH